MSRLALIKMFGIEDGETFNKCSRAYEKGRADAIDEFQEWLKNQIVGLDNKTKEILVVREDRWELAIDEYKKQLKEQK